MARLKGTLTNTTTGEMIGIDCASIDALTAGKMRECEHWLAELDKQIEDLKNELKDRREEREQQITNLRGYVRGERALPFDAGDSE